MRESQLMARMCGRERTYPKRWRSRTRRSAHFIHDARERTRPFPILPLRHNRSGSACPFAQTLLMPLTVTNAACSTLNKYRFSFSRASLGSAILFLKIVSARRVRARENPPVLVAPRNNILSSAFLRMVCSASTVTAAGTAPPRPVRRLRCMRRMQCLRRRDFDGFTGGVEKEVPQCGERKSSMTLSPTDQVDVSCGKEAWYALARG